MIGKDEQSGGDRRQGERRKEHVELPGVIERRKGGDRRQGDRRESE